MIQIITSCLEKNYPYDEKLKNKIITVISHIAARTDQENIVREKITNVFNDHEHTLNMKPANNK